MTDAPRSDLLTRFLLPHAGVRGVRVHLGPSWARIGAHGAHGPNARALLGEAVAASALFTAHTKVEGRLSIQLRGQHTLRTLFAECTAHDTLRGIVRLSEGQQDLPAGLADAAGSDATLAITIENPGLSGREPLRYQGLVALDAPTLSRAFEAYFLQSEQLPTRILLAADADNAAGLMLQKLPGDEGDDDGWTRASALFDTLAADELLTCDGDLLLHRLFHEESPEHHGHRALRFGCSCSRERVAAMLQSLGSDEAHAAITDDGSAHVGCEFCGQQYAFDRDQIDGLFTPSRVSMPAPEGLQ